MYIWFFGKPYKVHIDDHLSSKNIWQKSQALLLNLLIPSQTVTGKVFALAKGFRKKPRLFSLITLKEFLLFSTATPVGNEQYRR